MYGIHAQKHRLNDYGDVLSVLSEPSSIFILCEAKKKKECSNETVRMPITRRYDKYQNRASWNFTLMIQGPTLSKTTHRVLL